MFFDGLSDLGRVVVVGALSYAALIVFLRVSGARTLSKLHAFDLAVTVALGSTLATSLLSSEVSLAEGVLAISLLILLQFVVAWALVRWRRVREIVKAKPALLVLHGRIRNEELRRCRIAAEEIHQAIRASGYADLGGIAAVVLETDGSLNVIAQSRLGDAVAMSSVPDWHGA